MEIESVNKTKTEIFLKSWACRISEGKAANNVEAVSIAAVTMVSPT